MHIKYLHVERSGILEQIDVTIEDNQKTTRRYVEYLRTHEKYSESPSDKLKKKRKLKKLERFMK